jgi:hypothetical protein
MCNYIESKEFLARKDQVQAKWNELFERANNKNPYSERITETAQSSKNQCCGSESEWVRTRIRILNPDSDPEA